jgi:hypothetical protein
LAIALGMRAVMLAALGRPQDAAAFLEEMLAGGAPFVAAVHEYPFALEITWTAIEVGADRELLAAVEALPYRTPWAQAAIDALRGDLERAVDALAETGDVTMEAVARLRLAEWLVGEGRRAEADTELRRALAFYRSVGATHHVRRAETLLAASA